MSTSAFACALSAGALLSACGGSDSSSSTGGAAAVNRPAPPKSMFPSPEGKSLAEVVKDTSGPAEVVVSPAAMVFYTGENRYPFGVFHNDRSQISDAKIALYISKAPPPKLKLEGPAAETKKQRKGAIARARHEALEAPAVGPFPASVETLETQPAFRAQTTASDDRAATVVYRTSIDFPSDGEWRVAAVIEGRRRSSQGRSCRARSSANSPKSPGVGDQAPVIHTPTAADVGGDLSKITTRIPPDTQNKVDFADVAGQGTDRPLVCDPPVLPESGLRAGRRRGRAGSRRRAETGSTSSTWRSTTTTIPNKGVRPQVRAFHLPSEPWLFVIDRNGKIAGEVEGAFGIDLMTGEVEKVAE